MTQRVTTRTAHEGSVKSQEGSLGCTMPASIAERGRSGGCLGAVWGCLVAVLGGFGAIMDTPFCAKWALAQEVLGAKMNMIVTQEQRR